MGDLCFGTRMGFVIFHLIIHMQGQLALAPGEGGPRVVLQLNRCSIQDLDAIK